MKIDPDGHKIAGIFLACVCITGGVYYVTQWQVLIGLSAFLCLLIVFSLYFFRDPARVGPGGTEVVVSAADGIVIDVARVEAEGFDENEALRIAVIMNIFNVHVNRSPYAGKVVGIKHQNGKKLSAFNKRAEYENEYNDTDIETSFGLIRIRQIAGLIARRVVTRVKKGDVLKHGDKLGIIRFGSRVDVFLPVVFEPLIVKGDHVRGGETVIARPLSKRKG